MATVDWKVRAVWDGRSAEDGVKRLGRGMGETEGRMASLARGAVALGAAIGAAGLARSIITTAAEFEKLRVSLVTVTGSAAEAERVFSQIKDFAKSTPFQVQNITQAFTQLSAMGLRPTMEMLTAFGDTAASFGRDITEFSSAVARAAFGEAEALKSFGILVKYEGDKVRIQMGETVKVVQRDAASIIQALQSMGEARYAGGAERLTDTLVGKISNLKDAWDAFSDAVAGGGGLGVLKNLTAAAIRGVDLMTNAVRTTQAVWTGFAAVAPNLTADLRTGILAVVVVLDKLSVDFNAVATGTIIGLTRMKTAWLDFVAKVVSALTHFFERMSGITTLVAPKLSAALAEMAEGGRQILVGLDVMKMQAAADGLKAILDLEKAQKKALTDLAAVPSPPGSEPSEMQRKIEAQRVLNDNLRAELEIRSDMANLPSQAITNAQAYSAYQSQSIPAFEIPDLTYLTDQIHAIEQSEVDLAATRLQGGAEALGMAYEVLDATGEMSAGAKIAFRVIIQSLQLMAQQAQATGQSMNLALGVVGIVVGAITAVWQEQQRQTQVAKARYNEMLGLEQKLFYFAGEQRQRTEQLIADWDRLIALHEKYGMDTEEDLRRKQADLEKLQQQNLAETFQGMIDLLTRLDEITGTSRASDEIAQKRLQLEILTLWAQVEALKQSEIYMNALAEASNLSAGSFASSVEEEVSDAANAILGLFNWIEGYALDVIAGLESGVYEVPDSGGSHGSAPRHTGPSPRDQMDALMAKALTYAGEQVLLASEITDHFDEMRQLANRMHASEEDRAEIARLEAQSMEVGALQLAERAAQLSGNQELATRLAEQRREIEFAIAAAQIEAFLLIEGLSETARENLELGLEALENWQVVIEETSRSMEGLGTTYESTIEKYAKLSEIIDDIRQAILDGPGNPMTWEWIERIKALANELFLSLGDGLVSFIDKYYGYTEEAEAARRALEVLRFNMELANYRLQFQLLQDLGILTQAEIDLIAGLFDFIDSHPVDWEAFWDGTLPTAPTGAFGDGGAVVGAIDDQTDRLEQALQGLRDLMGDLLLGDQSALTPEQQYRYALQQYNQLQSQARGGNIDAMEQLRTFVPQFLRIVQEFSGGTATSLYGSTFARVIADLAAITGSPNPLGGLGFLGGGSGVDATGGSGSNLIGSFANFSQPIVTETRVSSAQAHQDVQELIAETRMLRADNDALRQEIRDLAAVAGRGEAA